MIIVNRNFSVPLNYISFQRRVSYLKKSTARSSGVDNPDDHDNSDDDRDSKTNLNVTDEHTTISDYDSSLDKQLPTGFSLQRGSVALRYTPVRVHHAQKR